jgi:hypothetical protein
LLSLSLCLSLSLSVSVSLSLSLSLTHTHTHTHTLAEVTVNEDLQQKPSLGSYAVFTLVTANMHINNH